MNGGTSGFRAMNDVLDTVEQLALPHATVIMITDGAFSTTPRTRRLLQSRLARSNVKVGFFLVGLSSSASLDKLGKIVQLGKLTNMSLPCLDEIAGLVAV
jgi:hypothetical protein